MKKFKLFIIVLLLGLCLCGCTKGEANDKTFKRVKVGMTPDQVYDLLGKPDDTETEQYFEFDYWFVGASSMQDAQKKYEKGIAVKYYLIIFFQDENYNFKIESKEDIHQGIWGKY